MALLTTIAFFVAGQVAFAFLLDFTRQACSAAGPFESLIRLLTHDNQMSDLAPTAGGLIAKTLDSLVMPVMSRAGLHRAQLPGARREQHGGRRVRRELER